MPKPLRVCPNCGAWLDSGERCDCQDVTAKDTAPPEAGAEAGQKATANHSGPVLAPMA